MMQFQLIEHSTLPSSSGGQLTLTMQHHVDRTLAADRKGGEALWEKALAVADARAAAQPGEWYAYLAATSVDDRAARRLMAIAERGRTDARFREAIISGWLSFSVAAITAKADDDLLSQLLAQPAPPTHEQAKKALATPGNVAGCEADAPTSAQLPGNVAGCEEEEIEDEPLNAYESQLAQQYAAPIVPTLRDELPLDLTQPIWSMLKRIDTERSIRANDYESVMVLEARLDTAAQITEPSVVAYWKRQIEALKDQIIKLPIRLDTRISGSIETSIRVAEGRLKKRESLYPDDIATARQALEWLDEYKRLVEPTEIAAWRKRANDLLDALMASLPVTPKPTVAPISKIMEIADDYGIDMVLREPEPDADDSYERDAVTDMITMLFDNLTLNEERWIYAMVWDDMPDQETVQDKLRRWMEESIRTMHPDMLHWIYGSSANEDQMPNLTVEQFETQTAGLEAALDRNHGRLPAFLLTSRRNTLQALSHCLVSLAETISVDQYESFTRRLNQIEEQLSSKAINL